MEAMPSGITPTAGPLARAISAEVRATLARQNMTVKELAEKCGLSQGYLGKRLRDEAPLNANDFESISKVLGKEVVPFVQSALDAAGYESSKEQS